MATELPPSSDFTGSAVTEGAFKAAITALRSYLSGLFGVDGTVVTALKTLLAPFNATLAKSGAYTVVAGDQGKVIKCTGTWTLSFTAAATLGDGFNVSVVNVGSGTITLDPNVSELIDGATTYALAAGQSVIVTCDGAAFTSLGKGGVTTFNTRTGAVTLAGSDVTGAGGALSANVVANDNGAGAIGSFAIGRVVQSSASNPWTAGNTYSGASIGLGSGTWRAMQAGFDVVQAATYENYTFIALFQRVS
jgi:hypothetical protein